MQWTSQSRTQSVPLGCSVLHAVPSSCCFSFLVAMAIEVYVQVQSLLSWVTYKL